MGDFLGDGWLEGRLNVVVSYGRGRFEEIRNFEGFCDVCDVNFFEGNVV